MNSFTFTKIRLVLVALSIAGLNYVIYINLMPDFTQRIILISWALVGYIVVTSLLMRKPKPPAEDYISKANEYKPPVLEKRSENVDAEIIHFLSILQEKGRLVDFLMDDITRYSDHQVAAAARVVHQGCSGMLKENFSIEPVEEAAEGTVVNLETGYHIHKYRLIGQVGNEPPFSGTLLHKGWMTKEVNLPRLVSDNEVADLPVIAPAEVEIK